MNVLHDQGVPIDEEVCIASWLKLTMFMWVKHDFTIEREIRLFDEEL